MKIYSTNYVLVFRATHPTRIKIKDLPVQVKLTNKTAPYLTGTVISGPQHIFSAKKSDSQG